MQLQGKKHMKQHISRSDLVFRLVRRWLWAGVAAMALCAVAGAQQLGKTDKTVGSNDTKNSSPGKATEQPEYILGGGDVFHINRLKKKENFENVVVPPQC